ncbi:MAG TPA: transketolase [Clostridiales bacterium]|jgi:transketolase|nr:transketolase [Clostridiales bacterium]HBE13389.1 transketolase [Clostridiales bacterium]
MKLTPKYEIGQKVATREAYGDALAEFGAEFENLYVLDADLSKSTKTNTFQKAFPDRFINCGIAEANMVTVAAGMATTGKIVFASSFAMFAAGRAFEPVRNSIGYPHLNVKIGATHAGVSVGEDGATHQCNEDIGLMRTIPGMIILNPADAVEARAAVRAALEYNGPVYLRFGRLSVPVIYDEKNYEFEIGKGIRLSAGSDVSIVCTGLMTAEAIQAAAVLKEEGISVDLINMHTIKPIDKDLITDSAQKTGCVVTTEEHNIIGGLGSAVCEVLSETCPVPVLRHGVPDTFGKSGAAKAVLEYFGMTAQGIVKKAKEAIALKK